MLKTSDKAKLREALQKNPPPDRQWVLKGTTYPALAEELSAILKVKVTPRTVRHYVRAIELQYPEWKRAFPGRGRPKKQESGAHEQLVLEVSEYLLQLTGFSESAVYEQLRTATNQQWPPLGKVSYHKLFKNARDIRPKCLTVEESERLIEHCCMVLGQALIRKSDQQDQWLLLWGIEVTTSFFNYQLINLLPDPEASPTKRGPGRPKKASQEGHARWVENDQSEHDVRLPGEVLLNFLTDCQRRLCVPISRVILPQGYAVDTISDGQSEQMSMTRVYAGAPRLRFSNEALAALPGPLTLNEILVQVVTRHYKQTAKPYISQLRREINRCREEYLEKKQKTIWSSQLDGVMTEAIELNAFYSSRPAFRVKDVYGNREIIRLTLKTCTQG